MTPEQLSLPDPSEPAAYTGRTTTSATAAALVYPKTGTQRQRVLQAITDSFDGLTDAQIQDRLHMTESTQRPRRVELVQQGWIRDSGRRRCYNGHSEAIIWVLTDTARRLAEEVA